VTAVTSLRASAAGRRVHLGNIATHTGGTGRGGSGVFWLVVLLGVVLVVYLLSRWARRADDIEADSAYLYENAQGPGYGSTFLNILLGRDER
jgi:L-amino acid N-acyltransferase YncA